MPFDKPTRNALARLVGAARDRLVEDLTAQLQTGYRLQPDGSALPLDGLTDAQRAAAEDLRELLAHYRAALPAAERQPGRAAFDRLVREIGFTVLNRLAALRLGEERGLVAECVRKGQASEGFQLFERLTGGSLGGGYNSYRVFLYNLFDELALELGSLFDTRTPLSHVFPTERALLDVLDLLNTPDLAWIWQEDETIGWIYQYYNDEAERKQMRDASQAPRNSRELAVRNQFFTPRYVVEFLADNTLGRLWYEMRAGDTRLAESCRYLVKQPEDQDATLPARSKKDPRHITMLDPAGGSGHFGLYCFDLFETIYAEAWDDPDLGLALREDHPDRAAYDRAVPRLILAHNIHIIDIDPRAVQIAALALWLRAQRSYQRLSLKAAERPRITRVNVVVAEPMPGDRALLEEFVAELRPRVLGDLVRVAFEKMQLAGEAGSLLKIEDEMREAVASAKEQWQSSDKAEQLALLPEAEHMPKANQLAFDISGITDDSFWDEAEARVLDTLRRYAEAAGNGNVIRRHLFSHDAAQGFAFIELCRRRYDVVLMNPPFGNAPATVDEYMHDKYRDQSDDLYSWFVERAVGLSRANIVGAITSDSFIRYTDYAPYRNYLISNELLQSLFQLGWEVLDSAYVSAAMCVLWPTSGQPTLFVDLIDVADKATEVAAVIASLADGHPTTRVHLHNLKRFLVISGSPFCYQAGDDFFDLVERSRLLSNWIEEHGIGAGPHNVFFRLVWEIPVQERGFGKRWVGLVNGGLFSPYYRDDYLCIDWSADGALIKAHINQIYPYLKGNFGLKIQRQQVYGRPGLTYGKRSNRFNAQVLPSGMIPSFNGIGLYPKDLSDAWWLLAYLNSRFTAYYLNLTCGLHKNSVYVDRVPVPDLTAIQRQSLTTMAQELYEIARAAQTCVEVSHTFELPSIVKGIPSSLENAFIEWRKLDRTREVRGWMLLENIESVVSEVLKLPDAVNRLVSADQGPNPTDYPEADHLEDLLDTNASMRTGNSRPVINRDDGIGVTDVYRGSLQIEVHPKSIARFLNSRNFAFRAELVDSTASAVSWLIGCVLGRWDLRIAKGHKLAARVGEPFGPIPLCAPAMLVGPDGQPATSGNIASEDLVRARPVATTLPPSSSVVRPTIPDSEYPLRISWDGILVDDPGLDPQREDLYQSDIVRRAREALGVLWAEHAGAIDQEACEIMGVRDLRDYFRKPGNFFADHLKRYSKSRRQAPIYWPLSTASGDYTIWVYYHRLTGDTLYTIVNGYVKPKIDAVQARMDRLSDGLGEAKGAAATALRDEIEDLRRFLGELNDFQAELLRVAALPYQPNLNDGVILNAAPLHKLFRLNKWAKDCKAAWEKLAAGEYDWAHIAYTIWPARVKKACETDRSIAIAHGLEALYKGEVKPAGKKRGRKKAAQPETEAMELDLDK